MFKIFTLILVCVSLAWFSEQQTISDKRNNNPYRIRNDQAFILLCVILVLFAGLRTSYNDTGNYIRGFQNAQGLQAFLSDPENLYIINNPLFYLFQALLKEITSEAQVLIFLTSAFIQISFMIFLKRYSKKFTFSVFLYFTLGTFLVSLAAIKQTIAMAILTFAFPFLEKKKWGRFYLVVLVAMLFHTYAAAYAVLPLFVRKPWKTFTFLFVGATIFVLMSFQEVILEFMEQMNALGKTLEAYEVLSEHTVNLFRVAVYAIPPLFSLCFARWINRNSTIMDNVLIHMSIISLSFMLMATQAGANMFARMAHYFELGTLCCLPYMIDKPFERRSSRLITILAILGFLGFSLYANQDFDSGYRAIDIFGWF